MVCTTHRTHHHMVHHRMDRMVHHHLHHTVHHQVNAVGVTGQEIARHVEVAERFMIMVRPA